MSDMRDGLVELYARYQAANELRAAGLRGPSAEDDLRGLLADLADLAGIRQPADRQPTADDYWTPEPMSPATAEWMRKQ